MRFAIVGPGRMGHAITAVAVDRGHRPVAELGRHDSIDRGRLAEAEAAFEFTHGEVAEHNVNALLDAGVAIVCGTTGWTPSARLARRIRETSAGVVLGANFSIGVNLFGRAVARAAREFGRIGGYDPFVHEVHHRAKRDTPSGTALHLAAAIDRAWPGGAGVHPGTPEGRLPDGAVHVTGTRAGHEPGRHTVGFEGPHDSVRLEHTARGRDGFALGAVLAAEWLQGRSGLYRFDEVVDDLLRRKAPEGESS